MLIEIFLAGFQSAKIDANRRTEGDPYLYGTYITSQAQQQLLGGHRPYEPYPAWLG